MKNPEAQTQAEGPADVAGLDESLGPHVWHTGDANGLLKEPEGHTRRVGDGVGEGVVGDGVGRGVVGASVGEGVVGSGVGLGVGLGEGLGVGIGVGLGVGFGQAQ